MCSSDLRLDGKECSNDPLFVTLVEQLHSLEPSADSAYYLGILNDKDGNEEEALKYYQESVALQTDNYKKANILYKIAVKFRNAGRRSSARDYAEQALSYQPSLGRAYLLIANMYADSANGCGDTQFNKRAVFWLAATVLSEILFKEASTLPAFRAVWAASQKTALLLN